MTKAQTPKLKWKVSEAPTGRYRSFFKRGWPTAEYPNQRPALAIYCDDSYDPRLVKISRHAELRVSIAFWREREGQVPTFDWRTLQARFATLEEAKTAGERYVREHPEVWPPEFKEQPNLTGEQE